MLEVWDRLSQELWDSWKPFTSDNEFSLGTEMFEEDGNLVMKTELPGMRKKDLDISLEGDRLTIKAEKSGKVPGNSSKDTRDEYYRHYVHTVTLPYPVKEDKITAKFNKGVLELRFPKGEEVKPRKIELKVQPRRVRTKKIAQKTAQKSE